MAMENGIRERAKRRSHDGGRVGKHPALTHRRSASVARLRRLYFTAARTAFSDERRFDFFTDPAGCGAAEPYGRSFQIASLIPQRRIARLVLVARGRLLDLGARVVQLRLRQ